MIAGDVYFYKNLAELAQTDKDKISFFDQNQKAFFLDPESDEWFNMMIEYAKSQNLEEEKIAELEEMKWIWICLLEFPLPIIRMRIFL